MQILLFYLLAYLRFQFLDLVLTHFDLPEFVYFSVNGAFQFICLIYCLIYRRLHSFLNRAHTLIRVQIGQLNYPVIIQKHQFQLIQPLIDSLLHFIMSRILPA